MGTSKNFSFERCTVIFTPPHTVYSFQPFTQFFLQGRIALLGVLSRKAQALLSIATNKSKRLSSGSTTIQENYLTMKLLINSIRRYHKNPFLRQYFLQFIVGKQPYCSTTIHRTYNKTTDEVYLRSTRQRKMTAYHKPLHINFQFA